MRVIDKCDEAFLQSCSRMEILQSGYGDDLEMHIAGMNSYVYCVERQQSTCIVFVEVLLVQIAFYEDRCTYLVCDLLTKSHVVLS